MTMYSFDVSSCFHWAFGFLIGTPSNSPSIRTSVRFSTGGLDFVVGVGRTLASIPVAAIVRSIEFAIIAEAAIVTTVMIVNRFLYFISGFLMSGGWLGAARN